MDASFALIGVLSEADLFGYAALEARALNTQTEAPSSEGLLYEARLHDLSGDRDEASAIYADAEALAIAAANLKTIDGLISDYDARNDTARAETLRSSRREIAERFDRACSEAKCRSSIEVPAVAKNSIRAEYPSTALREKLSGTCRVYVSVSETGEARDIRTDCSNSVFNDSAYEAARRTRFSPRFYNGAPQPDYDVILPIEFSLR
ncbi:MAG: energy transducer TonB [Pseudomonadota bacterium]